MPGWFPKSGAIKREIVLGVIAGIASFAAAHYLRKKYEESQPIPNNVLKYPGK